MLEPFAVLPGALFITAALAATAWGWLRRPWVGFLGAWFFLILAPTSSFVPIVTEVGAERRMYLPIFAVLAAMGVAVGFVYSAWRGANAGAAASEVARPSWPARIAGTGLFLTVGAWLAIASRERTKVFESSESLYGTAAKAMPGNDRALNNYATILLARDRHREALIALDRSLAIEPQYGDAYSNRAAARVNQFGQRRIDLAVGDAAEAMRWNPYDLKATNNRGLAFFESQRYALALADFTRMIALTRGGADAYLNRANVYIRQAPDDPETMKMALADVASALERDHYSLKAYLVQAMIYNNLKRPSEALPAIQSALDCVLRETAALAQRTETAPSLAAAEHVLLETNANRRTPPTDTLKSLAKFPHRSTLAQILKERARAERVLGEQERDPRWIFRSLDDLTRAIVFAPGDAEILAERGDLYLAMKRNGEAAMDFEQALKLDPDHPTTLAGRVKLYTRVGDFNTAWSDAVRLRNLGIPLDDEALAALRKASGATIPRLLPHRNRPAVVSGRPPNDAVCYAA
ncbi:MAG: hypothetical protein QM775_16975 [Pirellulales bacterium]